MTKLAETGARIRHWILATPFPPAFEQAVSAQLRQMSGGAEIAVAVRSSATAEDLPDASFAGQQETFLNVRGEAGVLHGDARGVRLAVQRPRHRLPRAPGLRPRAVALSAGVQHMVRSDLGASGVMFTLDTDSGFRDVVFITASYGLGETVVQGAVNPDEFYVYKPALRAGRHAIAAPQPGRQGDQDGLRAGGLGRARADRRSAGSRSASASASATRTWWCWRARR